MKAAVFHGVNQPLTIEDIDIDEPGDYEVLVRTAAAGVCHSELHMGRGPLACASARRARPRVRGRPSSASGVACATCSRATT